MVHLISVISICLQAFVGVPGCPHKAQTGGLCNGTLSWNKTIRSFCLVCSFYKMIPYWTFWNVTRYFLLHYWKNEDDWVGKRETAALPKEELFLSTVLCLSSQCMRACNCYKADTIQLTEIPEILSSSPLALVPAMLILTCWRPDLPKPSGTTTCW